MNPVALVFLLVNILAIWTLPRRWAMVPLLAGCLYITNGQGFDIGPARFTLIRALILAGFVRVLARGERPIGGFNTIDRLIVFWSIWFAIASVGHEEPLSALVFHVGIVLDCLGAYFLFRILCQGREDVVFLAKVIAILLLPVAIEMINEKLTMRNFFSYFGGVSESPSVREGRIRAQGPFRHSILAGTVGATCLPLMIGIWRQHRRTALLGCAVCVAIIVASSSSGPVLSAAAAVFALLLYKVRHHMRLVRTVAIVGYIALDFVMKVPAYFLMGRIDISGGSTGWHRARLIQSAFQHLGEWWFMGTDRTRHWMPTGVSWNEYHTDITNYYLKMGVWGGLPLMLLFIAILITAFVYVGRSIREQEDPTPESTFFLWAMGASLFSIAATAVSVSFFDQSFVFVYMVIAVISSVRSSGLVSWSAEEWSESDYHDETESYHEIPGVEPFAVPRT